MTSNGEVEAASYSQELVAIDREEQELTEEDAAFKKKMEAEEAAFKKKKEAEEAAFNKKMEEKRKAVKMKKQEVERKKNIREELKCIKQGTVISARSSNDEKPTLFVVASVGKDCLVSVASMTTENFLASSSIDSLATTEIDLSAMDYKISQHKIVSTLAGIAASDPQASCATMNSGDVKDKGSGNRRHSHRLGSHIATEEETDSGQGEEGGRRVTRGRRQILEDVRCVNRSRSKKLDTDRNTKNKSTKKRTNGHANEEESQTNKRAK